MKHASRSVHLCVLGVFAVCLCSADTYVAQNSAGNGSGSDCADANPASWFNASGSWGSGAGQIGPGITVHLCGTIASALTPQGNGVSGNPVTILFEPGAKVSMPACPITGCLNLQNRSYITVDGGTTCGYVNAAVVPCNGTVESTLNGTPGAACTAGPCSQQTGTNGVVFWGGTSIEIRNLNIWNMYVHTSTSDNASGCACQAAVGDGNGSSVHNIVSHDNAWSFVVQGDNSSVYNVSVHNTDHCFSVTNAATNVSIHDNECYNTATWDTDGNVWHHDGIHLFVNGTTPITGTKIYNNYFWGDWGNNVTAQVYTEAYVSNTTVFNNVFRDCIAGQGAGQGGSCSGMGPQGNGSISFRGVGNSSGNAAYNNTIMTTNCVMLQYQTNVSFQNNISCGVANLGNVTFAANSNNVSNSNAQVGSSGKLGSGSPAIGAGANLTTVNIPALDIDRAGVPRPATGNWDAGAYNYSVIAPPSGVSVIVQ